MYEVIVLSLCTSCISCLCCFVTGALCMIPKLLKIHKDGNLHGKSKDYCGLQRTDKNASSTGINKNCKYCDNRLKQSICGCCEKIIIQDLPFEEEDVVCATKKNVCFCPFDRNLE